MSRKLNIPKFKSEAEEADWWDQHREETAQRVEEAVAAGETTTLSDVLQRVRERSGRAPTVTVRLGAADAARARVLAARKGIPYETYLRGLLRKALDRDEGAR